jgi:hypothetical protein
MGGALGAINAGKRPCGRGEEGAMSELMTWVRVPRGSRLEVSVTPVTGRCVANAEFVTHEAEAQEDTELWTDAELQPGPRKAKLVPPHGYTVSLRVIFPTPQNSESLVTATVIKSDGSTFGPVKTQELEGKKGDPPRLVTIIVQTLKS